jgi:hypothetical protein
VSILKQLLLIGIDMTNEILQVSPGDLLVKVYNLDLAFCAYKIGVDDERLVTSWLEHSPDIFRYLPVGKLHEREAGFSKGAIEDVATSVRCTEKDNQFGGPQNGGVQRPMRAEDDGLLDDDTP